MKRTCLVLTFLTILSHLTAQEIRVSSIFSHSSYNKYQNTMSYEIGYNQSINSKNNIGFSYSQGFNKTDYNYIFSSDADGKDYSREVEPTNQRVTLSLDYTFDILNRAKFSFAIGPKIGLNYFKINEFVVESPTDASESYDITSNYWDNNKIGIGLLFRYERLIFSKRMSVSLSTTPEVIFFSRFGLDGSNKPAMIGSFSFNLGLTLNMKNNN